MIDNDQRSRTFAWVSGIEGPVPQILFDDPRIGGVGVRILAHVKLELGDRRSLSQLARAYPPPVVND